MPPPAQLAGSVRRPVFSVTSASFRPFPSPQMMFSLGTRTSLKPITPFSIAFSPMNRDRCFTVTPGVFVSTMNAVICLRLFPSATLSGVRAMTTSSSARVPLVHHSFSPFSVQYVPSPLGVALVRMFAGSEPASVSVSANAEIAPFARRGKKRCFCSAEPNNFSGCGKPMD